MQVTEVTEGNPVLSLSGEIDMASAEGVAASLRPLIRVGGPVTIDLSKVTFMDSIGLHVLLEAAKELGERGCIILHGANGAVAKLMEIIRLEETRENIHTIECSVLLRAA